MMEKRTENFQFKLSDNKVSASFSIDLRNSLVSQRLQAQDAMLKDSLLRRLCHGEGIAFLVWTITRSSLKAL